MANWPNMDRRELDGNYDIAALTARIMRSRMAALEARARVMKLVVPLAALEWEYHADEGPPRLGVKASWLDGYRG